MKNNNKIIIGVVLVVIVGLIWFGGKDGRELNPGINTGGHSSTPNSVNVAEASSSADTEVDDKNKAPDFTLASLGGGSITLSDYIGEKPVVLDFFATWCHNCQRDMPKLSKMYEKYSDQVEVIGINMQESESKILKFVDSKSITFPIVLDPRKQALRSYGVRYTNYHVLIDIEGNIAGVVPGDISESQVLALIATTPSE